MDVVTALAGVFGVVAVGYGCRALGWLEPQAGDVLMRLVIRLFFPAFLLSQLLGNPMMSGNALSTAWRAPAAGLGLTLLAYLVAASVAYTIGPRIGLTTPDARRTFVAVVGVCNFGYVPIQIVQRLLEHEPGVLPTLLVHNLGGEFALWAITVPLLAGGLGREGSMGSRLWRVVRRGLSPPVLAILAALLLNFLGWGVWLQDSPAGALLYSLGQVAIPIAVLLIGATIHGALKAEPLLRRPAVTAVGVALRLVVIPVLWLGVMAGLRVQGDLLRVVQVEAAMPSTMLPIVLSRVYGGDIGVATRVAVVSTLVSLVTIPLVLGWLL